MGPEFFKNNSTLTSTMDPLFVIGCCKHPAFVSCLQNGDLEDLAAQPLFETLSSSDKQAAISLFCVASGGGWIRPVFFDWDGRAARLEA